MQYFGMCTFDLKFGDVSVGNGAFAAAVTIKLLQKS